MWRDQKFRKHRDLHLNLRSVFSSLRASSARAVCSREGLTVSGRPGLGRQRVVVARSLVRVRQLALPADLALSDQWGALRAQALAWQPFDNSHCVFGIKNGRGLILAWDATAVAGQLVGQDLRAERIEWVPEPLLCAAPANPELRLLRGLDGHEGQYWEEGFLRASRWWPDLPNESEWLDFARSSGAASGLEAWDTCPAPTELALAESAWIAVRNPGQQADQNLRAERWLVGGAALALLFATMPVLREHLSLQQVDRAQQERLTGLRSSTASVAALQSDALAALRDVDLLVKDLTSAPALDVLRYLAEYLPKEGVILREVDLEGRKLKLTFELGAGVSRSSLVERMQAGGWFETVSEQQGGLQPGWVSYQVLLGARVPAAASRDRAASAGMPSVAGAGGRP